MHFQFHQRLSSRVANLLFYTSSVIIIGVLSQFQFVQAGTVSEESIELESSIAITNIWNVHFSTFDDRVYYTRRDSSSVGNVYRLNLDQSSTLVGSTSAAAGLFVDPDDGDIFVTEDFPGYVRRITNDGSSNQIWVSGFAPGDDDPAGIMIVPDYYIGSMAAPGDAFVTDRGFNSFERLFSFSKDTAQGEIQLLQFEEADGFYGIVATDSKIIAIDHGRGFLELTYDDSAYSLVPIETSESIPEVKAAAWDPVTGLLFFALNDFNQQKSIGVLNLETGFVREIVTEGIEGLRWGSLSIDVENRVLYAADYEASALLKYNISDFSLCHFPLLRPDTATAKSEFVNSSFNGAAINTINGSGMPLGFNALAEHEPYESGNHWSTDSAFPEGNTITWGFDEPKTLTSIILWNHQSGLPPNDGYEVTLFDLTLLDETGTELFELLDVELLPDTASGQILGFGGEIKGVSDVRFNVVEVQHSLQYTGLAEVAFNARLPFEYTTFDTEVYAWSGNTGWVNFAPCLETGVRITDSYLSGYAYNANTGWLRFGGIAPQNGINFSNTGDDHGVNHDGLGHLSGYAWSGNTGWVNFNEASLNDPNAPRIDLLTGQLSGYAWNANTGWLNLGTGLLESTGIATVDYDGDNMADSWEYENFSGLESAGINTDFDGDGEPDAAEYISGTDPTDRDSYLRIISINYNAGLTTASIEFTSSPTRLYYIEYSNDLGVIDSWEVPNLPGFLGDPSGVTSTVFSYPTNEKKFFRVRSTKPSFSN